ncbi:MAG: hypothetical protein GY822_26445 [Deltaproteobacteria bacterium]|nr:hypothetical protein [Deltaproteobacteria bacterium]
MNLLFLSLSVAALLVGPLLLTRGRGELQKGRFALSGFLDGFALVTAGGLAALHLLPEALSEGGGGAAMAALLGLSLPFFAERVNASIVKSRLTEEVTTLVLLFGLLPHVGLEGATMGVSTETPQLGLGLAIASHRLPVGLLLFSMLLRRHGRAIAWGGIGLLVFATLGGYSTGDAVGGLLSPEKLAWLQALVGGALLHVVSAHRLQPETASSSSCCADESCASEDAAQVAKAAYVHPCASPGHDHDHGHGHFHEHDEKTQEHDAANMSTSGCASLSCSGECGPELANDADPLAQEPHLHHMSPRHIGPALGALLGVVVVAMAMLNPTEHHNHDGGAHSFVDTFVGLALETAPALLLAYLLAGIIGTGMTASHAAWLDGKTSLSSSIRGVIFGLPLPICSCGVLPLYEALVKRGVPVAAALGFLIATPELSLDALLISVPLLGPELSIARLVAAFVVAVVVSTLVGHGVARLGNLDEHASEKRKMPLSQRIKEGARFGLVELFDHTMPWVLAGLLMAALFEPLLSSQFFSSVPTFWQVPLFALLGIPVYVCASGATPVAAIAILKGVSPGAAIAFLLAGPATNLTTFGVLRDLHGKKVAVLFGLGMTLAAMLSGWSIDAMALDVLAQMQSHAHEDVSWLKLASLIILGVLLVGSLFRQGPRGLVEQVIRPSLGG